LVVEEVHRSPNGPISVFETLRWDVLHIFDELKNGLRKVAGRGNRIESMSNDSWGLDFVYVRGQEPLLTLPYHYRDRRTDGGLERAFAVVPAEVIYSETGIQFMQFNSLYQLLDDLARRREILELSEQFLGIGDYFNYLFSGVRCAEESLASTTQLLDSRERRWAWGLIERFGLPAKMFPRLVPSGTKLGPLLPPIAEEVGLEGTEVVASCSHDTAAAVAAVPAQGEEWAYISSGTWSLLGIEASEPIINAKSREYNFANEIGYKGTVRFLKNIAGLWIVQECRREWAKEGQNYTHDELTRMAEKSEPLKCLINPAERRFVEPNDMPRKVIDYCRETGQVPPRTEGETIRCILESLALQYHQTLLEIEMITGRRFKFFHIVGGGSKNSLLNQLTADAAQLTVLAGPTEATAIGNILVQAIAVGQLDSLIDLRRVVRRSFPITTCEPHNASTWQNANERFERLTAKSLGPPGRQ
jgi:rhamnulokinase